MKNPLFTSTRVIVAICITLIMFFPIYWMLITALKTSGELRMAVPTFWPDKLMWENFANAFKAIPFYRFTVNTVIQTVGIVFLQINIGVMAAYAFAKGTFPGRDYLFVLVLAALIVPEQVVFVPIYVMLSKIGWINTYYALIIPHAASAYGIFLLRQMFRSINNDVIEAAKVDGASRFQVLYRILTPMAMPTVATLTVISFIHSWNAYFWPLVMTNSNKMRVLTVGIAMMRDSIAGDEALNFHLLMAASILVILPIVIMFVFAQKYIVAAMANSTFK
ncbi:ABC-type glycerol-3-phosphate transport system permease component [Paenibacillus sp. V4I3]|uniref:carbohydrate ABC transporter permease n=1 Tax=unclassified Paenibacillus TaxID=185978 RepID=UPI002788D629|nr:MULTISPECIES: carbohydrate ABC transporter permease [unclassified Paenibacillus]MDQ0878681.1 ABC-type glycerol-3-phosphate transport system permease component [Paenibacillus sp. V4I3]MDQ0885462.1 ABC-type glycerol-3-phosphate transport system permease component [Paenibacillus sp. V4I9]